MRQGVCGVDVGVCGGWVSRWVGGCGCVRACVRARVRTCVCVCGCVCLCVCVLICVHVQMRMPRKGYTLFRGQCLSLLLFLAYQLCTFACVCVIFRVGQNRIYDCIYVFLAGKPPNMRPYAVYIYVGLARTVYIHRIRSIYGGFPAKNTVYTPCIYGSVQPYIYDTGQP